MKNIAMEEKNLKRYLKNKISFNIQTMVKFLIMGIVITSFIACNEVEKI